MDKKDPKDQKYQLSLALEQLKNSDEKIKASLTSSDPEVDYICLRNLLSNIKAMEKNYN